MIINDEMEVQIILAYNIKLQFNLVKFLKNLNAILGFKYA